MAEMSQGLRERKKQQTRDRIRAAARELFVERGFERSRRRDRTRGGRLGGDRVQLLPDKEDLFFGGLEEFEQQLLDSIRLRDPGESVLTAFGRFVLQPRGLLAAKDPESIEQLAAITRVIDGSPRCWRASSRSSLTSRTRLRLCSRRARRDRRRD